jgi:hypothetical protein
MVLTASMMPYGWGQNTKGQIGVGTKRNVYEPILVRELIYDSKVLYLSAGGSHTLAVCDTTGPGNELDRTVWSWGCGGSGRLGLCKTSWGTDDREQLLPRRIRYLTNKRVIRAYAGGAHSIALVGEDESGEEQVGGKNTKGGKIFVWGEGKDGQLGNDFNWEVHRPQFLKEAKFMFLDIKAGQRHTIALTKMGELLAWGYGQFGELGHGEYECRIQPTLIRSFDNNKIDGFDTRWRHSCALLSPQLVHVRDNPQYERYIKRVNDHPQDAEVIQKAMEEDGLNPDYLFRPEAVLTKPIPKDVTEIPRQQLLMKFSYAGGMRLIVDMLRGNNSMAEIVQDVSRMLEKLAAKSDDNKIAIAEEGAIPIMMKAMERHRTNPDVVEQVRGTAHEHTAHRHTVYEHTAHEHTAHAHSTCAQHALL